MIYVRLGVAILTFLFVVELSACRHSKALNQEKSKTTFMSDADTSVFAILSFNTAGRKDSLKTNLSAEELSKIQNILQQCIREYNIDQEKYFEEEKKKTPKYRSYRNAFLIDLLKYKRQYVPAINDKGEKVVWVNCFCSRWGENWKERLIMVEDGGNCYFNLSINLTTGKYSKLKVNGVA
jgi:hypothetical protein